MNEPLQPVDKNSDAKQFFDVRMRGFRDRAEVFDVLSLLSSRLHPLAAEAADLHVVAGRILAADVLSEVAVPAFNRAAMDGYSLRGEETFGAGPYNPLEFVVIGEAMPGRPFTGPVAAGQAVRIMTGAPMPDGADAVLPAEAAEEKLGRLRVSEPVPPCRNVGRRGEDIEAGAVILQAGRVLRPQDVGILASIGAARPPVVREPTVALIVTGDELLPAGAKPEGYRIIDSNSVMLEALVRRDGGIPQLALLTPDSRAAIEATILGATADVLMISGGTSVGREDHAPSLIAEHGELCFHGMALRPASPTGVGFLGGRPVFLLPGNPVSCLCAYDFFAGPAIRRLGGRAMSMPYRSCKLPLARKIASVAGRVDYVRVAIQDGRVEALATSGASILSSTTRADGFVLVPSDSEGYPEGVEIQVYFYDL